MTDHDDSAPPPDGEPLPYREVTDEKYAESAARTFTVDEPDPGTLVLRGPCPRCHALIDIAVVDGVFRTSRLLGAGPWRRGRSTADHEEPMLCTCQESHPGRPDDAVGCGAYWTLVLSRQDG
ncbi:hypothetical protein GKC29_15565 [Micromonospora sp. WMMC415]|uniref:hypothetical protein n=1 Tax=Micromonospora sp. WMMC415 TaxID=2675222 RepID=UPI0012B4A19F|nr:hypothetical protein [Micromonospora sp. WMMC415]QGN48116.1 hypothetical protein GKC29_15565 [Micromonospora sp. WMMC415]